MRAASSPNLEIDQQFSLIQMVADSIPAIIFQFKTNKDGSFEIIYVCDQLRRIFDISLNEAREMPEKIFDLIHEEDMCDSANSIETSIRHKDPIKIELKAKTKRDGYRWYRIHATAFKDEGDHTFWNGIAVDISEDKAKEKKVMDAKVRLKEAKNQLEARVKERTAELESAKMQLEDALSSLCSKNRELQDFAFVASHDLQAPLRKIGIFTSLLMERYAEKLDERGRDYCLRLQGAAVNMDAMLQSLLEYSRVTTIPHQVVPVDLNHTMKEIVSVYETEIETRKGKIECDHLPSIFAEPKQIERLFQNLIGNALKYQRPNIPPRIRVKADTCINQKGGKAKTWVTIYISDNGIGFDPKYRNKIFTPFERLHTRGDYEGSGMGLAICKKIVEYYKGEITVESTPGKGTTFIVRLPLD